MAESGVARAAANERPTIHDVARLANVSPATVSKVLRGIGAVKADNVARIHEAVRELGFRVDPLAANLRRSRRSIVGLVVPDFRNPFFGSIVAAFEQLAEADGYRLVAVSSAERTEQEGSPDRGAARLARRRPDRRADGRDTGRGGFDPRPECRHGAGRPGAGRDRFRQGRRQ